MKDATGERSRTMQIVNQRGLHARASAKFVKMAETFNAEIQVTKGCETVGGTSIMGLMMLAASKGCSITVSASGPQADEAIEQLDALVSNRFGEDE